LASSGASVVDASVDDANGRPCGGSRSHLEEKKSFGATSGGGAGVAASDDFQRGALKQE